MVLTRLRKDFCLSTLCAIIVIIITTTFGKTNKFYIIASLISVRFLYSVVNDLFVVDLRSTLGGTSGLEPPTSRLSGARSNQLSYAPALVLCSSSSLIPGGDDGIRTHDPLLAGQVLSQLSYTPICGYSVPEN